MRLKTFLNSLILCLLYSCCSILAGPAPISRYQPQEYLRKAEYVATITNIYLDLVYERDYRIQGDEAISNYVNSITTQISTNYIAKSGDVTAHSVFDWSQSTMTNIGQVFIKNAKLEAIPNDDVLNIKGVGRFYSRDIMCSNFLVLDTNAWIFNVPVVCSQVVRIISFDTNDLSAVNYKTLVDYVGDTDAYATITYSDGQDYNLGTNILYTLGEYTDDRVESMALVLFEALETNKNEAIDISTNNISWITNGLATIEYVDSATNQLVTADVTNGLATIEYVDSTTNGCLNESISFTTNILTAYYTTNETDGTVLDSSTNVLNTTAGYTDDRIESMALFLTEFCESNHNTEVSLQEGEKIYWIASDGSWTNWMTMNQTQMIMRINNNDFITQ